MSTGYTAKLYEGEQTFKEFALQCSRNFGALLSMRDKPFDAEIPDVIEPNIEYYNKRLNEVKESYNKFLQNKPTRAQAEIAYEKYAKEETEYYENANKEKRAIKQRYTDMLEKAKAWIPPTDDHKNLKEFMISQLEESIDFDCKESLVVLQDKEHFIELYLSEAPYKDDIAYYELKIEAEKDKAKSQTEWIQQLKKSLEK